MKTPPGRLACALLAMSLTHVWGQPVRLGLPQVRSRLEQSARRRQLLRTA